MVARTKAKAKPRAREQAGIDEKLKRAKQEAARKFLSKPHPFPQASGRLISADPVHNVVGVGIGPKRVDGKDTDIVCVRLYVRDKLSGARLTKKHALPAKIGGFPTDIIEVGSPRILHGLSMQRMRPARPGCTVAAAALTGISGDFPGTFGALVQDLAGKLYILSNNHVLAVEELCPLGTTTFQPGGPAASDRIGKLASVVSFNPSRRTTVDCALAAVTSASNVNGSPLPPVGPLSSAEPIDAQVGMVVEKFGAATGHTVGTVTDISADFQVDEYLTGTVFLEDQIQISDGPEPFCAPGDSGALVVDKASKRATGLLAINMGGFALPIIFPWCWLNWLQDSIPPYS
jgi:hypothetical protein